MLTVKKSKIVVKIIKILKDVYKLRKKRVTIIIGRKKGLSGYTYVVSSQETQSHLQIEELKRSHFSCQLRKTRLQWTTVTKSKNIIERFNSDVQGERSKGPGTSTNIGTCKYLDKKGSRVDKQSHRPYLNKLLNICQYGSKVTTQTFVSAPQIPPGKNRSVILIGSFKEPKKRCRPDFIWLLVER